MLSVQQRLQVDFSLVVGDLSVDVTVVARADVLQTQKADIGLAVTQRTMTDLPLLGRRYSELAFLAPGVAPAPAGIGNRGEESGFNANGNFSTWNNYTLDGADNNSFTTNLQERSVQVVQPPVDALEEFRVQTRTYSAEFGRAAGAVINASIKQGTNAFRGNAYEFFRDEALNANRWENNRAGLEKAAFRQDIFGGTLGGPIRRDRTFFFVSYQGTRTDRELTGQATVPTPLMRQGNLSELPQPMLETAFAPGCVNTATKVISASCLDPVAMKIMQLYPAPNIPSRVALQGTPGSFGVSNFINNQAIAEDVNQLDIRVDQNLRDGRDRVFGRYSLSDTTRIEEPLLGDPVASGDFNGQNYITGQSAVLGWTRVFGSSMVNEFRGSWNNIDSDVLHPAFGMDVNAQYGITGLPTNPLYSGGLPHLNIGGLTRIGGPFFRPQFQQSYVWQFSDNLSWSKGSHDLKMGVERRRDAVDYIDLAALNGLMTFSSGRYTNVGIGDFLLGLASQQRVTLLHEAELYTDGWQFYGQDSWRVTPTFTLTYGLRYEYFTPMLDRNGLLTNIDPVTGKTLHGEGRRQHLRARPDRGRPQQLRAARRLHVAPGREAGGPRRLRRVLPAHRSLWLREPDGAESPATGRRRAAGQLAQRGAGGHPAQRLRAGVGGQHRPDPRAVAPAGTRPEDAGGAAVQPGARVRNLQRHGVRRRVRGQPDPQRPPAAQPQPGHHRDARRGPGDVPLRAVRVRERLPPAGRHVRQDRLPLGADPAPAPLHEGLRLHRPVHLRARARRLPRSPQRRRRWR